MLKIDGSQLVKGTQVLERAFRAIQRAEVRAVNYAADRARTKAKRLITDRYHLTSGYVAQHLKVRQRAKPGRPEAVIWGRKRPVRLARYGARQLTAAARGARGDSLRGIGSGRKQAGVSVKVLRAGARHTLRRAFLLPLRRGKMAGDSSVMGIFVRTGRARHAIKHLYSRSVDQAFSAIKDRGLLKDGIYHDLNREFRRQLGLGMRGWLR